MPSCRTLTKQGQLGEHRVDGYIWGMTNRNEVIVGAVTDGNWKGCRFYQVNKCVFFNCLAQQVVNARRRSETNVSNVPSEETLR
jgi:hypothetical protein